MGIADVLLCGGPGLDMGRPLATFLESNWELMGDCVFYVGVRKRTGE